MKKDAKVHHTDNYFGMDDTHDPWDEDILIDEEDMDVWRAMFMKGEREAIDEGFDEDW